jgi:restriction system protein
MAPQNVTRIDRQDAGGGRWVIVQSNQTSAQVQAPGLKSNRSCEHGLDQVQNILRTALDTRHTIDLERFKGGEPYPEPEPPPLRYLEFPPEPQPRDAQYRVRSTRDKTHADLEQERRKAHESYLRDYAAWGSTVKDIEAENQRRYAEHEAAVKRWKAGRDKYLQSRAAEYEFFARRKAGYETLRPEGVEEYFRHVLSESRLPDCIRRVFDLQYVRELKLLIVDHAVPCPEAMPHFRGMVHLESKGALVEVPLSEEQMRRLYFRVICQLGLRTLHELFDADMSGALDAIAFNGWIQTDDKTAGSGKRTFVAWVQAKRDEFKKLNLRDADAEASFKALRGGMRDSFCAQAMKAA